MGNISSDLAAVGIVSFLIALLLIALQIKGNVNMDIDIPAGKTTIKGPAWFIPIGVALFCWIIAALLVNAP